MMYPWLLAALLSMPKAPSAVPQDQDFACLYKMNIKKPATAGAYGMMCSARHGIYSASRSLFYSANMACLLRIYKKYDRSMEDDCYFIQDARDNQYVTDLRISSSDRVGFAYEKSSTKSLREIRQSYLRWARRVEKEGIDAMIAQQVSPLAGTPYVWVKKDL